MIARLAYAIAIGLLGAGVVHIVSVLAVPDLSETTALDALAELGPEEVFHPLEMGDPHLRAAACLMTLDEPHRAVAEGEVPFWSASVFAPDGAAIYSVNDRAASDGLFDLIIASPEEVTRLREELAADGPELVAVPGGAAMVVLRALAPDATLEPRAQAFLRTAACDRLEMG